jgi:Flp pilus assembly protein protease CpaA
MVEEPLTVRGLITGVAYGVFAVGVLAAALVDVVERRIPNRITYPLIVIGVLGLPWLSQPVTGWALLAPLLGAVASGLIGLLNALLADQGLGDLKLAIAVGAWMAHLGLLRGSPVYWSGQLLMIGAVAGSQIRRRQAGLPPDYTPLGPSLAGGAVLAVAFVGIPVLRPPRSLISRLLGRLIGLRLTSASLAAAETRGRVLGRRQSRYPLPTKRSVITNLAGG